ncbi:fimbria/pilus periplasmic chaperone [Serratia symbiotica]|uniref:fimbria/pilus periplasmic chaperone n=1 Tax=Serratia symbiotica TaxID=138074 RepID=UPI001DD8BC0C|nr:fimbria/pilus periplasmic chaperone [Serratia symbiotica]NIG87587.1 fimbria/pilus periplasmic chaperone [Serratia symbiotica]USS96398.1 fimbria/pilus periplasmic chaperone [Serratia symbiotica]
MLSTQLVNLNPYFSLDWQNRHYRDLGSSQYDWLYFSQNDRYPDHYNMHYTASMGGSFNATERLSLGLALSRNTTYDAGSSNGLFLFSSWSGDGYALSQSISYNWCNNDRLSREWSWLTNLNIPFNLGGRRVRSSFYLNNVQGQTRIGTSFSQTFTDNLQLSAGIERSAIDSNNEARHFIRASWLTPYNNTSWYYSENSRNNRNYSANLSGPLVAAKSRLVFSSDTFAIADTAMKGSVTLLAPTGRTITNYDGLVVIPQLQAGNSNVITIDTKYSAGMTPNTSAVIIEEQNKEGTIEIKNTDAEPMLLYSKIVRLADDDFDGALIPSPAAVLVQAGETQVIRVLLRTNKKMEKEHLARVEFSGIPTQNKGGTRIDFLITQDLLVVIRPSGYTPVNDKWTYLKWKFEANQLCLTNDTKMVIRIADKIVIEPNNISLNLPKTYAFLHQISV